MKTVSRSDTVIVEIGLIWDLVAHYSKRCTCDGSSVIGLEALANLLIDTPIGDDVVRVWHEATGGIN